MLTGQSWALVARKVPEVESIATLERSGTCNVHRAATTVKHVGKTPLKNQKSNHSSRTAGS